jgi:hypothetical protein
MRGFQQGGGMIRPNDIGRMGRQSLESRRMNAKALLKAYLAYLAFNAVTKIVVRPVATSLNVPLITTIVS